ncbi:hypothetical protein CYLTODRAFT_485888 [Cylindrobasidium torrendii FP15055 ss-10]|uniref:C2H2-type domain-containing protein n=1 Tax=Cylindrobasidium torrendii FP15055 ss-10 TaxID=1314674 RepID=A0A0D7BRW7_9AGAR|nr:hypothetical protein CYLTODRAFT_485888 [Cylindrobasidium torrendii FP15055 ss-10]
MPPTTSASSLKSSRAQHSGNAPVAPRIHACTSCDAKFTRISHLERHLLSHTNQREHKCSACNAEFTRRDLLVRHGKSCSGSPAVKSRRKSCEACAVAKVKCDMNNPCNICVTKGKSCVFLNDPATSKRRKAKTTISSAHRHQGQNPLDLDQLFLPSAGNFVASNDDLDLAISAGRPSNTVPEQLIVPLALVPPSSSRYPTLYDSWSLSAQQQHLGNPNSSGVFGAMWELMHLHNLTPDALDENMLNTIPSPTSEELNEYLELFLERFNVQVPLLHRQTMGIATREPILLAAMQACGAVYAGTPQALKFMDDTIITAVLSMGQNVVSAANWTFKHDDLIISTVLLQFLCIHNQSKSIRNMAKAAHDQLYKMIDNWNVFERVRDWTRRCRPEALKARHLSEAWTDWARCESLRRALMASLVEDGCMFICFASVSSRGPDYYDFNLSCDESLWQAQSAAEWRQIWRTAPSPSLALTGLSNQLASRQLRRGGVLLAARVENKLGLQPMDLFYLIHAIVRDMFERALLYSLQWPNAPDETEQAFTVLLAEFRRTMQNWLVMWTNTGTDAHPGDHKPFFVNALPFYWLGQVMLWAFQYGNLAHLLEMGDKRVFVIDAWLQRIRLFLRSGANQVDMWAEVASVCQRTADTNEHFPLVETFTAFLTESRA